MRVVDIEHPTHSADGKYFNFVAQAWGALSGSSDWHGKGFTVVQKRGGELVWQGKIMVWNNADGVHGRRDVGAAPDQWRIGDIVTLSEWLRAIENYFIF